MTYCHASSSDQYLSEQNTVKMFPVRKSIILTVQTLDRRFYRWQLGDTTNYINYRQTESRSGFAPTFVNIWRAAAASPPRMDTRLRNDTQSHSVDIINAQGHPHTVYITNGKLFNARLPTLLASSKLTEATLSNYKGIRKKHFICSRLYLEHSLGT